MQQANQFEPSEASSDVGKLYQRRAKKLKNTLDDLKKNELDSLEKISDFKIKLQIQYEYVEAAYFETRSIQLKEITEDLSMNKRRNFG